MPNIDFYYKRSRLNQLKGFCSVVQNDCCIAKASKKTNVAQDTISKQVRTLERDLKIKLFERTKHHTLIITQEGQLFYDKAIANLNAMNSLFENFHKDLKEFNNNHLRIAISSIAATCIFPKILKKMLTIKDFNNISINIFITPKTETIKKLLNKEVDIAFHAFAFNDKLLDEVESIKTIKDNTFVVFNNKHPLCKKEKITMEDLLKYKFLARNINTKTYSNIFKNTSNIVINGNSSYELALEMIKATDNITTLPELFLMNTPLNDSEIQSRNISNIVGEAYFYIMTRKGEILTKPMTWLINELKSLKFQ